jgi:hypothetical protein
LIKTNIDDIYIYIIKIKHSFVFYFITLLKKSIYYSGAVPSSSSSSSCVLLDAGASRKKRNWRRNQKRRILAWKIQCGHFAAPVFPEWRSWHS